MTAKLFLFIQIGVLGGFWFRITLSAATTSTETYRNVDTKMLKVCEIVNPLQFKSSVKVVIALIPKAE